MSAHLSWMIIRNNNAYLLKKRNIPKPFSTVSKSIYFIYPSIYKVCVISIK